MMSTRTQLDVAVIGTGFSGIGMAVRLKKDGVENFAVFEKAADMGGTWRDNLYPGCACDVPSHLYSFSFAPKADWSRAFATQPEIQQYIKDVATEYKVESHIRYQHELTAAEFDEQAGLWQLSFANGEDLQAKNVVMGIGGLHVPLIPKFEGVEDFKGEIFHSAQWRHDVDLSGKRVAVIGTGASAIQIIPAVADQVERLVSFQRTAPWVMPKPDREYSEAENKRYARYPLLLKASRGLIYTENEIKFVGFKYLKPAMKLAEIYAQHNINKHISNRVLRRKVTPLFDMGCKRILLSNDYYPALAKDNVDVVKSRIERFTANGIQDASGTEHEVDVVIYATGFRTTEAAADLNVRGRQGQTLAEAWQQGAKSYLGIQSAGFPNAYFLMGPNTGLGHNSMVYMIESQIRYVADALKQQRKQGWAWVDVKAESQQRFISGIQAGLKNTVWASGCQSWYLNEKGENWTLWPGFTFAYRLLTRRFDSAVCELNFPATDIATKPSLFQRLSAPLKAAA